ncbi:sugar phosphate isomerase/epimerase family protein [Halorussus salinisoli]|uniref:sugar phosphate isomerase/epimerase family protein n=1 Tax=Halorussus salinisoli TaxID=2558242 RepID=UPI0010C203AE|nr:sugar phosphate isomerase/epimerase [Halorussus salinisoli]
MELGLLTATCHESDLHAIAARASDIGYETLELAAWPADDDVRNTDELRFSPSRAAEEPEHGQSVLDELAAYDLTVESLAYYPNNLHPDPEERQGNQAHLKDVIRAASNMDIDLVGTFIGRDPSMPIDKALEDAKSEWPEIVAFAERHDVRLMIENCPMDHYGAYGTNLFYSPAIWDELFEAIDSDYLGLNYDPSHLYWLDIDHTEMINRYSDRIFQAHAKDTEIRTERRDEIGILADRASTEDHWWRYRIPGLGDIDWSAYIRTLYDAGFDGALVIEHEDPTFETSVERFWKGAEIGYRELAPYL